VSEAVRAYRSQAVAAQASGLLQRYRQTRDLADLHAAIRLLRESVTAAPRTRIYYAQRLLTCDTIGGLEGQTFDPAHLWFVAHLLVYAVLYTVLRMTHVGAPRAIPTPTHRFSTRARPPSKSDEGR